MLNEYYYRKHIKKLRNLIIVFLGISIILLCLLSILIGEGAGFIFMPLALILILEAVIIWYFMGRFNNVIISTDDEKLIYKNHKEEKIIKFEDIEHIQFPSIKYLGGWMKIRSKQTTIRFTVVIKDIHKLSLEIKEQLDMRGLNHVYKEKGYISFINTAVYSDDSWERLYGIWWKLLLITIGTIVSSILIGLLFQFEYDNTSIFTMISFIFPTVVYVITEVAFAIRVRRLLKKDIGIMPTRDTEYEGSVYKKAIIWSFLVYVLIVIFFIL